MTVPVFSQEEFIQFLKDNGCIIVSSEHWNEYDVLVMEKDGEIFNLTLEKKYFYILVVPKCLSLGIMPPEDHLHSFNQHFKDGSPCFCRSGKMYKECHGEKIYSV